jgi:uncharacterized protein (UPF0210 family)
MKKVEIEVVVDQEGIATLHVQGMKGKTCTDLTDEVEKALGKITKRTMTREAIEAPLEVKQCARH